MSGCRSRQLHGVAYVEKSSALFFFGLNKINYAYLIESLNPYGLFVCIVCCFCFAGASQLKTRMDQQIKFEKQSLTLHWYAK